MTLNIAKEVATMGRMTRQLQDKHIEVFGERTRSSHKQYLINRIAWRMQANAYGDLSVRARRRAEELANDADLRTTAPKVKPTDAQAAIATRIAFDHDPRLPMPGAILKRQYKDREIVVRVLPKGFELDGEVYRSLSAVAKAITGKQWNGFHFFQINRNGK